VHGLLLVAVCNLAYRDASRRDASLLSAH
jgi:hypothetical protein